MTAPLRRLTTFVMAGGRGKRLYPLTRDRAKPAVPFGGIYRIIDFTLSNCINSGIRRINVLTQYKSDSLAGHIKMGWNVFHSELHEYVDVVPAQQRLGEHWYRGTADAIRQNLNIMEKDRADYVLILAGDHIYKMDYTRMLSFHIEKAADVTVGVVEMPKETSRHFGVLQVDRNQRIRGFAEKPAKPRTVPGNPDRIYASMGIYIFNKKMLLDALTGDTRRDDSAHDFGNDILPCLLRRAGLYAYRFTDENRAEELYWKDIGTLDAYYRANMDLVSVSPVFNLYDDGWPVRTYQPQLPPVKMVFADEGENARRGEALDSVISTGCIISGGRVVRSVLSPGVRINSYSLVEDSVLMDGAEVGRYAKVRNAVIDKHVQVPPGMVIGYDLERDRQRFTVTDSGIVVISTDTVIRPDTLGERPIDDIHVAERPTKLRPIELEPQRQISPQGSEEWWEGTRAG